MSSGVKLCKVPITVCQYIVHTCYLGTTCISLIVILYSGFRVPLQRCVYRLLVVILLHLILITMQCGFLNCAACVADDKSPNLIPMLSCYLFVLYTES